MLTHTIRFGSGYPGPNCFKQLRINANGKSAVATVMDQCPGCAYGDLDMSPDLFSHFADHSVGRFPISWEWMDSSAAPAPAVVSQKGKLESSAETDFFLILGGTQDFFYPGTDSLVDLGCPLVHLGCSFHFGNPVVYLDRAYPGIDLFRSSED